MLAVSTLIQQRSFGYTWLAALRNAINIPSGIITGISLVSTVDAPVAVSNISVTDDGLSITLLQNNELFASVLTTEENAVVTMTGNGSCVSAVITTGAFMASRFTFAPSTPQYIRRAFLTVVTDTMPNSVTATSNGESAVWNENTVVAADNTYLSLRKDANGNYVIYLNEEQKNLFRPAAADSVIQDDGVLYSLNGVTPGSTGAIRLSISHGGTAVALTAASSNSISITKSATASIPPCDTDDYIDRMISPARAREFDSQPLDAAYSLVDGKYVRDYKLLEGTETNPKIYAEYAGGLTLYERNPLHDPVS